MSTTAGTKASAGRQALTDSCSAGHNSPRARKRRRWGPPAPAEKEAPSSCIKGVPGAARGLTKWACGQDNLNKGFSVKCPKAWECDYWARPSLLRSAAQHTPPRPRTNMAVCSSFSTFANQPPLPFAWGAVIASSYLHCPCTRPEDYVGESWPLEMGPFTMAKPWGS